MTDWDGFGLRWYEYVLNNKEIQRYLINSADRRASPPRSSRRSSGRWPRSGCSAAPKWFRLPFDALTYVSVIVPELVIALATLVFFASTIGRGGIVQSTDRRRRDRVRLPHDRRRASRCSTSASSCCSSGRGCRAWTGRMVEASYDLFGTPWRTFWQITFPQLLPAIVAGFLLSFTFAFDDYLITTFVNGRGTSTMPLYVFGQIRKGVTPATNAVAAIMLFVTLGDPARRPVPADAPGAAGGRRGAAGVAGMIVEQQGG